MAITTTVPAAGADVARPAAARGFGTLGLGVLVTAVLGLGASAASGGTSLVPAARTGLPGWLAGPLAGLGVGGSSQAFLLVVCGAYALVLTCAPALGRRVLWSGIVSAHVAALAGPPLFSADVFGYLDFARLGVLHGLDPYTHTAAAAVHDAVYPYLGWHDVHSPYGPLFTLFTYALVPLGVAGGIWALKVVAAAASLATAVLVWRAAARRGHSPERAAVLLGLNPLVLVFAVAGAHNDTLVGLILAGGLVLCLDGREPAGAAGLLGAAAGKLSAGLALPFALLGARGRGRARAALAAGALALAVVAAIAAVGFGPHAAAIAGTVRGQQQVVATHSLPSEISRLLGAGRLGGGVRAGFTAFFVVALLAALAHAWRRPERWLEAYAWATLALLCSTAWLLPWYGLWALVPAALSGERRLRRATLVLCAYLVATRLPLADPLLGG
jgi:alpha-1,6-mannosyltransferase